MNFILTVLQWKEHTIIEETKKEKVFLRFFFFLKQLHWFGGCNSLRNLCSAINILWASSVGLSGLGLIYRYCIGLSEGAYFLYSVEQWWVIMTKGKSEIPLSEKLPPSLFWMWTSQLSQSEQLGDDWHLEAQFVCRESRRWNKSYASLSLYVSDAK